MLDPDIADDVAACAASMPGDLAFAGHDDADRTWLVGLHERRRARRYYAYDRGAGEATLPLRAPARAGRYSSPPMEPFAFTARDGLEIHGYLTFPPGAERRDAPGRRQRPRRPVGAGHLGLRPRGAVAREPRLPLHPGQLPGLDRLRQGVPERGDREWGGKMHDDLVDAVGWSSTRATPTASGSRSTAAPTAATPPSSGAAFTPDVFRCAVDIVGPSSLKTLIESIPPYWAPLVAQFHTRVGNPDDRGGLPLGALTAVARATTSASRSSSPRARTTRG